jgi:hypothetical protein
MMSAAKVPKCYCDFFWREAFQAAIYLNGLTVVEFEGKKLKSFEHWEGQLPRFVNNLRKWGEIGIVKLHKNLIPKIYERGKPCMFARYCLNHAGDTFRMWEPYTKHVHLSRGIMWTGRMYFDSMQKMLEGPFIHPILKNKNNNEINDETSNEKKERMNENDDEKEEKTINKVSIDNEGDNQIKTRSG